MDSNPSPFKLGTHGGKRVKGQRNSNGVLRGGSNSRAYIEARLERDSALGCRDAAILLAAARAGRVSWFACGCEMSYCRRPELSGRGSPNVTKRNDWAMHRVFHPRPQEKAPPGRANGA